MNKKQACWDDIIVSFVVFFCSLMVVKLREWGLQKFSKPNYRCAIISWEGYSKHDSPHPNPCHRKPIYKCSLAHGTFKKTVALNCCISEGKSYTFSFFSFATNLTVFYRDGSRVGQKGLEPRSEFKLPNFLKIEIIGFCLTTSSHKSNFHANLAHHTNNSQIWSVEPLSDFRLDPPLFYYHFQAQTPAYQKI